MANRIWKLGTKRGIAYVEGAEAAARVRSAAGLPPLELAPTKRLANAAAATDAQMHTAGIMAVYSDRRGRPFAWQFPFDVGCWEAVEAAALAGEG